MTWREISVDQLEKLADPLLIDVRSPCEHVGERIFGSFNIPLLTDAERSIIGTIYAKQGDLLARREALRFISPKISPIVETIISMRRERQPLVIHCWRGGLRSEAVASVLSVAGVDCFRLTGGYKAWRNYVLTQFNENRFGFDPIVLQGLTGTGKTDILEHLALLGASVLNLEEMANHRGSVFGSLGLGDQPTQKNFDADLWSRLKGFKDEPVFLEAESRKVGKLALPDCILTRIKNGRHILVTGTLPARRARILLAYAGTLNEETISLACGYIDKLKERLGAKRCAELMELANDRNLKELVDILLAEYYDPLYVRQIDQGRPYDLEINGDDPESAAQKLYQYYCVGRSPVQLGRR